MENNRRNALLGFFLAAGLVLALVLAAGGLSTASAEQAGVLIYSLDGSQVTITDCKSDATWEDVSAAFGNITGSAIGREIVSIDYEAFSGCNELTKIVIPAGVTAIGSRAFERCVGLKEIDIPDGVTDIGDSAFFGCEELTEIKIPEGVTTIGDSAFSGCEELTEIKIPEGVTTIGGAAFYGCEELTEIKIPKSVTDIGDAAFFGCEKLTAINVDDENDLYFDEDGVLFNEGYDGLGLCRYPPGKTGSTSYTIPYGVSAIESAAFQGCDGLTEIIVLDRVTTIGDYAFHGCKRLAEITIPYKVTTIGQFAFSYCENLAEIIIPSGVTTIGFSAFFGCKSLAEITIPDDVTVIEPGAFFGCESLTEIDIPDKVTIIDYEAFSGCTGLTEIDIPDGVTTIGNRTFYDCSGLTEIVIPNGVTAIDDEAFSGCRSLTEITIPKGVTSVGDEAFRDCTSLSEIVIEAGMTDLPIYFLTESTFKDGLRLHVPRSVLSVGGAGYFSTALPPGAALSGKPAVYGIKDSFIVAWAQANGAGLVEIDGTITRTGGYDAWLRVPYQHIIETAMPENVALSFRLTPDSGPLPDGLFLMQAEEVYENLLMRSGQFYGAPMETGVFALEVEVRSKTYGYLLDVQAIELTVRAPDDAMLIEAVNDYGILIAIGTAGPDGAYWVTERADQTFAVANADLDGDGEAENNFDFFEHFWIDGAIRERDADYRADPGSTVVTLYARVLQDLDDADVHTASAEFSVNGVQYVAAQNFRVDLPAPTGGEEEAVPGDKPGGDGKEEGKPNENPAGGGKEEGKPGDNPPAEPSERPADGANGSENAGNSASGTGSASGGTQNPNAERTAEAAGGSNAATGADNPPGPAVPANANAAARAADQGPAQDAAPDAADAAREIAESVAPAPDATTDESAGNAAGAGTIDGLSRDANGLYYFELDGSGRPLEARIDIPLADFEDLYFDGALWTRGADYETREGSTVLTVAAERLAGLAFGMHEIDARFAKGRTVAFAFDLRGAATPPAEDAAEISASDPSSAHAASAAGSSAANDSPAAAFLLAAAVLLLAAGAFLIRARRRAVRRERRQT